MDSPQFKCSIENETLLKQKFGIEGLASLHRIVAIDKICVRDFKPELKSSRFFILFLKILLKKF